MSLGKRLGLQLVCKVHSRLAPLLRFYSVFCVGSVFSNFGALGPSFVFVFYFCLKSGIRGSRFGTFVRLFGLPGSFLGLPGLLAGGAWASWGASSGFLGISAAFWWLPGASWASFRFPLDLHSHSGLSQVPYRCTLAEPKIKKEVESFICGFVAGAAGAAGGVEQFAFPLAGGAAAAGGVPKCTLHLFPPCRWRRRRWWGPQMHCAKFPLACGAAAAGGVPKCIFVFVSPCLRRRRRRWGPQMRFAFVSPCLRRRRRRWVPQMRLGILSN